VIALSGAFDGRFLPMASRLGADAVLGKPLRGRDLRDAVATVLTREPAGAGPVPHPIEKLAG